MKITSNTPVTLRGGHGHDRAGQARTEGEGNDGRAGGPATRVSLSSDGAFVQSLRDQASTLDTGVRADVVAETKAALADGSFEQSVDMDKVVDALLSDL